MAAMNPRLVVLLLCASLFPAVQAKAKTILPDSCGDDSVTFDVSTKKDQPPPPPPAEGKAQIVFIEDENAKLDSFRYANVRYGLDGAWVGANYGDSYFIIDVTPGVHHVCANVQASKLWLGIFKKAVDMATFTAEAGKVYYFSANMKVTRSGDDSRTFDFTFSPIDEEEGRYRVKAWKVATWKIKK
jgi:hypothetical protein